MKDKSIQAQKLLSNCVYIHICWRFRQDKMLRSEFKLREINFMKMSILIKLHYMFAIYITGKNDL